MYQENVRERRCDWFLQGIWAPLLSTSFSKSLSVLIFTDVKPSVYKVLYGDGPTSGTSLSSHPLLLNAPVCMVSGFIAGGGVSVFACPFEFTKVYSQILVLVHNKLMKDLPRQLQTNHQSHHGKSPSTAAIFRQIVRHEGIKGLYSGYKYHFLRDSISSGVYYSIYESLKWTMNSILDKYQVGSPQISILLAGGFLGILGWTVVFPYDTTKSLIQKDIVTNILRKEQGLEPLPLKERKLQKLTKNLYRGLGISITRTFIVNMAFFSFYEFTMAHIA